MDSKKREYKGRTKKEGDGRSIEDAEIGRLAAADADDREPF